MSSAAAGATSPTCEREGADPALPGPGARTSKRTHHGLNPGLSARQLCGPSRGQLRDRVAGAAGVQPPELAAGAGAQPALAGRAGGHHAGDLGHGQSGGAGGWYHLGPILLS